MKILPTVEIVIPESGEKMVINEVDFDPKKHTLWTEKDTIKQTKVRAAKRETVEATKSLPKIELEK